MGRVEVKIKCYNCNDLSVTQCIDCKIPLCIDCSIKDVNGIFHCCECIEENEKFIELYKQENKTEKDYKINKRKYKKSLTIDYYRGYKELPKRIFIEERKRDLKDINK